MEEIYLKIDAQWRLRFETRVRASPWSGPGSCCISGVVGQSPLPESVDGAVGVRARLCSCQTIGERHLSGIGCIVADRTNLRFIVVLLR
jgi:hypothetical protein